MYTGVLPRVLQLLAARQIGIEKLHHLQVFMHHLSKGLLSLETIAARPAGGDVCQWRNVA